MHYDENVIDKNLNCNFITDSNNFNSRILEITKKESLLWGLALFCFVHYNENFYSFTSLL